MDGAGANMCKAVNIDGVAVKATFVSRVCVGGKEPICNCIVKCLLLDWKKVCCVFFTLRAQLIAPLV